MQLDCHPESNVICVCVWLGWGWGGGSHIIFTEIDLQRHWVQLISIQFPKDSLDAG